MLVLVLVLILLLVLLLLLFILRHLNLLLEVEASLHVEGLGHGAVHARRVRLNIVLHEAGLKEGRIVEQPCNILGLLRVRVALNLGVELHDKRVAWVNLHNLLGVEVLRLRRVRERLRPHDALHVGRVAVLRGDEDARGGLHTRGHNHLGHLLIVDLLEVVGEWHELLLVDFEALLIRLLIRVAEGEALLAHRLQLLAVVLGHVLNRVLVNGVDQV
mmetsp:Transcript_16361/g.38156  ORF Transcript_16361/g.38156 Transcript_16361/m.38156 type:complete len:216 (+) Transcript_16361:339-986(+)